MFTHSLLKTSGKSWYSFGTEVRSTNALEVVERAFAVTSERASWKTSVPAILQMQANVAVLMRVIFGALSFGVASRGMEIGVASEAEACKGETLVMSSAHVELFQTRYCPIPNQLTDCSG